MNLSNLTLIERLTVRVAMFIYYAFIFTLFLTFIFLFTNALIEYLTLGKYDIWSL